MRGCSQIRGRYHKRHATLLEVLIAMTLTILVLTTLMFFYQQVSFINIDIDKVQAEHFNLRYVENRLAEILPRTISEKDKRKDFVYFNLNDEGIGKSGSQSLIFTFDNEVSLDKIFSNHVIGRLYLDKNDRLILAYWPSPKRLEGVTPIPMKKEILFEGAESLAFEFFIPPEKAGEAKLSKPSESPSPEPKGDWRRQLWSKDFNKLPAMVRVIIGVKDKDKKGKETITFVFPYVNVTNPVIYD